MPGRIHAGPISGPLDAVWRLGLRKRAPRPAQGPHSASLAFLRVRLVGCSPSRAFWQPTHLKKGV
jgi:hypothetical protein